MSVSSIGSSSTAQADLLKAQQKLAFDTATKAAAKVIAEDKVAVAAAQKVITQQPSNSNAVDIQV